jgi:hypothetical protein
VKRDVVFDEMVSWYSPLKGAEDGKVRCRNLSFGLATKVKGLQGYGPKGRKPGSQGRKPRGQNPMTCGILYIIGKLLKCRCLKWARIAHSDI